MLNSEFKQLLVYVKTSLVSPFNIYVLNVVG